MAPTPVLKRFALAISVPVLVLVCLAALPIANFMRGGDLWVPGPVQLLLLRIALVLCAGFLVTHLAKLGVWAAVGAGAVAFFAEQVLVVSLWLFIDGQTHSALRSLQAFFFFVPVPLAIAGLGGLFGRAWRNHQDSSLKARQ